MPVPSINRCAQKLGKHMQHVARKEDSRGAGTQLICMPIDLAN